MDIEKLQERIEKLELQIFHLQNSNLKKGHINLKDFSKPWKIEKPKGLHIYENGLRKETRNKLWKFFHPKNGDVEPDIPNVENGDFSWVQRFKRFPKTAHYNGWHSGKYEGKENLKLFEKTYPELYNAVNEAYEFIKNQNILDIPNIELFIPESVSVMRHKPDWGLGRHYDNAQDENTGIVLLITISENDIIPRKFNFVDAPCGKQFTIDTTDSQIVIFGGQCYDYWQHESLRNKKQSGEVISITVRSAKICGSSNLYTSDFYKKGAPAAMKVAHERLYDKIFT